MDGDRQDDPAEIPSCSPGSTRGTTWCPAGSRARQDPLSKTLPSKFFNWTVRKSTGVALHDFNCGLKAYRREVTEHVKVYGELHRYVPVLASDLGFRVAEEKVAHRRRTAGRSKYGWRRYARGYLDLLTVLFLGRYRQRPQHLFGGIGTMMVVVGLLVDLYLTIDKFFGHPIGQRPLLLLGTLLIIVGIQLLSLGLVGELITQARARDTRDDYEVARVFDGASAASGSRRVERRSRRRAPAPGPVAVEQATPSPASTRQSL